MAKTKTKAEKYNLMHLHGLSLKQRKRCVDEGWADRVETKADIVAIKEGCYYDHDAGQRVINFFEKILMHKVDRSHKASAFLLLDWQKRDLSHIFGWKKKDGYRRFRYVYLEVPKKNGKSTMAGGVALYLLVADGEPSAEIYTAATTKEQAKIVMRTSMAMAEVSNVIKESLKVIRSTSTITHMKSGSFMRALTKDGGVQEGLNISGAIIDELHVFKSRELWDSLLYGGDARKQSLHFTITTAGAYNPTSIGWEQHRDAERIIEGSNLDTTTYVKIYCVPKDADWTLEENWIKANPSMGTTLDIETMRKHYLNTINSPAKESAFRRYRLNQWTNKANAYFDYNAFMESDNNLTRKMMKGNAVYVGVDLASRVDLTSVVYVWRNDKGKLCLYPEFWIPECRTFKDNNPNWGLYRDWAEEGWINLIKSRDGESTGKVIDQSVILDQIMEVDDECGGVQEVGYDPWNASQFSLQLLEKGVQTTKVRQGTITLSEPMKTLDAEIIDGNFAYNGNPVFDWCMENTLAEIDKNDNVRPKKITDELKIDGAVAGIIGIERLIHAEHEAEELTFRIS